MSLRGRIEQAKIDAELATSVERLKHYIDNASRICITQEQPRMRRTDCSVLSGMEFTGEVEVTVRFYLDPNAIEVKCTDITKRHEDGSWEVM